MQYLSVHDFVWINATATGAKHGFEYDRLEAAMAAQYCYGNSTNVSEQAANLLSTMLSKPIFDRGNQQTAFVAVAAFLEANGKRLNVSDEEAANIVTEAFSGKMDADSAISILITDGEGALAHGIPLRSLVTHLFNAHSTAIKALSSNE